ncbi:MAG: hypothetical protein IJM37_07440 [Lachnospiraceae bacterium]|nr:hypothetical protein [Lachnospiraceae bacterium]
MSLLHYEFNLDYELMLSAWGRGILQESDLIYQQKPDSIFSKFYNKFNRYPTDISLFIDDPMAYGYDYGFTGVDTALLEKLETLSELILPDSITHIDVTPELERIIKKNNTLIRGNFDSYAEQFAVEYGLRFRPSDYIFATHYYEYAHESTIMSLVFGRDGSVQIKEDISSPGSSAGNTFGGTFYYKLSRQFYKEKTAEQIAEQFRNVIYDATIEDGRLAAFIEKAKTHKIYMGKNR